MSKIQIEEIESLTTNTNLKVIPNGTGVLEVSGDTDGALQLDDVKVKAPPSSAAQDYTLTIPTANVTADKFIKVDSITGSGSTAVGQLEYESIATPSASPIDGVNFTSGTVPSARYSLGASNGGGVKLIQSVDLTGTSTSAINFTSLDENAHYRLIGKSVRINNTSLNFHFFDGMGNQIYSSIFYHGWYGNYNNHNSGQSTSNFSYYTQYNQNGMCFTADIVTGVNTSATYQQRAHMHIWGHSNTQKESRSEYYVTFNESLGQKRIYGLSMYPASGSFDSDTKVMLYKIQES
tara:strand:- start:2193 stop:3068 length:876 start_codon:yes stop_codon:yes gene_type:complete